MVLLQTKHWYMRVLSPFRDHACHLSFTQTVCKHCNTAVYLALTDAITLHLAVLWHFSFASFTTGAIDFESHKMQVAIHLECLYQQHQWSCYLSLGQQQSQNATHFCFLGPSDGSHSFTADLSYLDEWPIPFHANDSTNNLCNFHLQLLLIILFYQRQWSPEILMKYYSTICFWHSPHHTIQY